jgi:hypothetical protein
LGVLAVDLGVLAVDLGVLAVDFEVGLWTFLRAIIEGLGFILTMFNIPFFSSS